jgi:cell division inhibitor SulA/protein ImuA
MPVLSSSLSAVLDRPDVWRGDAPGRGGVPGIPSGFAALDAELPGGGWPVGALTEIFPSHEGIGELRLLGPALASLARRGERLAWIAPPHLPYAPALAAAGIDPAKLVIVRAASAKDALWAAEQALRSNACGAVLAWPEKIAWPELRRLQLATEGSQALAVLFRPPRTASEASPAALRLALDTCEGDLAVRVLKRRGAVLGRPIRLHPAPVVNRLRPGFHHAVDFASFPALPARIVPAGISAL